MVLPTIFFIWALELPHNDSGVSLRPISEKLYSLQYGSPQRGKHPHVADRAANYHTCHGVLKP